MNLVKRPVTVVDLLAYPGYRHLARRLVTVYLEEDRLTMPVLRGFHSIMRTRRITRHSKLGFGSMPQTERGQASGG